MVPQFAGTGGEGRQQQLLPRHESDEFRMYSFKVKPCGRTRSHDWTDCPYAHQGEKARRRDPCKYLYQGIFCREFKLSGECRRAEFCAFAHGVFELWLHPSRYRTRPCKAGLHCCRKVCFFAHTLEQLRGGEYCYGSHLSRGLCMSNDATREERSEDPPRPFLSFDARDSMMRMQGTGGDSGSDAQRGSNIGEESDSPDIDWIRELVK